MEHILSLTEPFLFFFLAYITVLLIIVPFLLGK